MSRSSPLTARSAWPPVAAWQQLCAVYVVCLHTRSTPYYGIKQAAYSEYSASRTSGCRGKQGRGHDRARPQAVAVSGRNANLEVEAGTGKPWFFIADTANPVRTTANIEVTRREPRIAADRRHPGLRR